MKTSILITLCICFSLGVKAQNDSSESIKYYNTILGEQQLYLTNPSEAGPCSKPLNTVIRGKRDDIGLPFEPPPGDNGSDNYTPPPVEDVNIYWIHGLNGSVESLRVPAITTEFGSVDGTFPARKAHSIIGFTAGDQTYLETNGIIYAARDMRNAIDKLQGTYIRTEKDFIIAHSQGGIVAREWLRDMDEHPNQFKKYAHGLVTFGTPHGGAMILNKTRPELENQTVPFMKEACKALGKAVVVDKARNSFLLKMILSQKMKDRLTDLSCDFFAETVVPFAIDNYHKPTTLDYYVGSPFLTSASATHPNGGLSNYTLKVPVVQFYGEEEQPVMWRYFSSNFDLGKDQALQAGNATLEYAYDKDDQLQGKVSNLINDFEASYSEVESKYKKWKAVRQASSLFGISVIIVTGSALYFEKQNKEFMDDYDGAIDWLYNANDYYQTQLLGARDIKTVKYCLRAESTTCMDMRTYTSTSTTSSVETIAGPGGCFNGFYSLRTYQPNSYTTCNEVKQGVTVYRNEYYYKPNDGVVLAESAAKAIKTEPGASHKYQKMERTNHDQMKNCRKTKDALTDLYNGKLGSFFKVEPR